MSATRCEWGRFSENDMRPAEARMGTLIGIAVVVLVGFAILVLQQDAAERKRAARIKPARP
jgi:hypothetical protein